MECRDPHQTALVVNLLIGDLVQDAVNEPLKLSDQASTCRRLIQILGLQPEDSYEEKPTGGSVTRLPTEASSSTLRDTSSAHGSVRRRNWHTWLANALAEDTSDEDVEIFRKYEPFKILESRGVQTEQPRLRLQRHVGFAAALAPGNRSSSTAPCEMTRQTVFIEAVSVPIPNVLGRPPLADRFCYMLTDFASALYCSLAIMCCCTPNMLR